VKVCGWSPKKRRERKGEESRQTFPQVNFDEWHFVARPLQHAEASVHG
jgi:hypothetical protein